MLATWVMLASVAWAQSSPTLVFTASNRGELRPCGCPGAVFGGLAKRATLLTTLNETHGRFALVDAGDALLPAEPIGHSAGRSRRTLSHGILDAMRVMQYDVVLQTPRDLMHPDLELLGDDNATWNGPGATTVDTEGGPLRIGTLTARGLDIPDGDAPLVVLTGLDDADISRHLDSSSDTPHLIVSSAPGATLSEPLLTWTQGNLPIIRPTPKGKEFGLAVLGSTTTVTRSGALQQDGTTHTAQLAHHGLAVQLTLTKIPRSLTDEPEIDAALSRVELESQALDSSNPWEAWVGQSYAGVGACVGCHEDQVAHWETTAHARAWASLEVDGSHERLQCVACHATGFGVEHGVLAPGAVGHMAGVQCEVCHGPSLAHVYDPTTGPPVRVPDEALCRTCHQPDRTTTAWSYEVGLPMMGCLTTIAADARQSTPDAQRNPNK